MFEAECHFYQEMWFLLQNLKWNVALATGETAAWESERDINLTEGMIAQWLCFSVKDSRDIFNKLLLIQDWTWNL